MVKYVRAIEVGETFATIGEWHGGYREDHQYSDEGGFEVIQCLAIISRVGNNRSIHPCCPWVTRPLLLVRPAAIFQEQQSQRSRGV